MIDRRGAAGFGGGVPGPVAIGGGLGIPALLLIAVMVLFAGGSGINMPFDDVTPVGGPGDAPLQGPDPEARLVEFVDFVVGDTQSFWRDTFAQAGRAYRDTELVLFRGATQSACGGATSDIGPHYCPADERIYLDLEFFRELSTRFGAPGDFAQAYVLAHEVGHHVQHVMGISDDVRRAQQADPGAANELSIALELQADCFAGVWAFTTYERRLLETGDLEEGLAAAAAVGDDRIQREATGRIDRETWTHGSSAQRVRWFSTGFEDGDPNACDTFGAESL